MGRREPYLTRLFDSALRRRDLVEYTFTVQPVIVSLTAFVEVFRPSAWSALVLGLSELICAIVFAYRTWWYGRHGGRFRRDARRLDARAARAVDIRTAEAALKIQAMAASCKFATSTAGAPVPIPFTLGPREPS